MLHCHDGKADCSDVLYIFSVRMSVYHASNLIGSENPVIERKDLIGPAVNPV